MRDASFYSHPNLTHLPAAEWAPRRYWSAPVPFGRLVGNKTAPPAESVAVVGNHGRWVVECPDCHGAQLAAPTDRRFMCVTCGNATIGGLWRRVVWPADADEIAAALDVRPNVEARNWSPGETSAALRAENAERMGV